LKKVIVAGALTLFGLPIRGSVVKNGPVGPSAR